MMINNRDIIIAKYSTEENWMKTMPRSNWLCILIDNNRELNYLNEVVAKIIENDVCYICTMGQSCQKTYELIEEEIIFRGVDIEKLYLPEYEILISCQEDFEEGIRFALYEAQHEKVLIHQVFVLDMTNGLEYSRLEKLLINIKEHENNNKF